MDNNKLQMFFNRIQSSYLAISVVYVIFGLCLAFRPETFSSMICFSIGLLCIIYCAIMLVQYFSVAANQHRFDAKLILPGIVGIFGLIIMFRPQIVIAFLPTIVGILMICSGIMKARNCIQLKKSAYSNWWLVLIFALISLGLGITIFLNPFGTGILFIRMVGIFFIIDGLLNIYSALTTNNRSGF